MKNRRAFELVRVAWIGSAVAAVAIATAAVIWMRRPAVTVTRVIEGPVVQAFYATGTVRPRLEYPIRSNVPGIVDRVLVTQGESVKKGQPLAFVSDPDLQYDADKARAELQTRRDFADEKKSPILKEFDQRIAADKEMLRIAQQLQERFTNLSERNAASANDRDQAIEHTQKVWADLAGLEDQRAAKLRELQQDVEVAESADRAAQENLRRQTLVSPIDGVVLDEPIARGTHVEVNGHLMQVADVSTGNLVMRAAVDEENIAAASAGQAVKMTLYSFPGRTFDGVVEQKYPKADPARRTFDVDVKFANPDLRLQAGMTGEMAFIEQTRDRALIIPAQAVQNGVVWLDRDGRLAKADATLGIRSIERVEVTAGLIPGDRVVISPLVAPAEGQRIRIASTVDPKVAADLNKPKETEVFSAFK